MSIQALNYFHANARPILLCQSSLVLFFFLFYIYLIIKNRSKLLLNDKNGTV